MIGVEEPDLAVGFDDSCGDCSWTVIAEAIRAQAKNKPAGAAADLNGWADLLEGIGKLTNDAAG